MEKDLSILYRPAEVRCGPPERSDRGNRRMRASKTPPPLELFHDPHLLRDTMATEQVNSKMEETVEQPSLVARGTNGLKLA